MALNITFANNKTYQVHPDTLIYPSNSPYSRSVMEIHVAENKMSLDDFIALMSDENNLMTMRHILTDEYHKVVYDNTYIYYIVPTQIGKKLCSTVDPKTGATKSEYHLVAVLEQLTETEQRLRELEAQ